MFVTYYNAETLVCIWWDPKRNRVHGWCCYTQVPFDLDHSKEFAIGTKVYLGAILANKQYTWSGEAIVKSVFLPFRLLKACQADEKSAYVLTQSHVLLEHVKLALKENMPSKAKLPKF